MQDLKEIQEPKLGKLLPGATPINNDGVTYTGIAAYHGTDDDEQSRVLVHFLEPQEILVETLCAMLGRTVDVSIPRPFILGLDKDSTPDQLKVLRRYPKYAFAYFNRQNLSLVKKIEDDNFAEKSRLKLKDQLHRWKSLARAIVFDEFIGNGNRRHTDLLTDGVGNFFVFNHAQALPEHQSPDCNHINTLAGVASSLEFTRRRVEQEIATEQYIGNYNNLDYTELLEKSLYHVKVLGAARYEHFMRERCKYLVNLIDEKIVKQSQDPHTLDLFWQNND